MSKSAYACVHLTESECCTCVNHTARHLSVGLVANLCVVRGRACMRLAHAERAALTRTQNLLYLVVIAVLAL